MANRNNGSARRMRREREEAKFREEVLAEVAAGKPVDRIHSETGRGVWSSQGTGRSRNLEAARKYAKKILAKPGNQGWEISLYRRGYLIETIYPEAV